jgi:SAM-dependent methyltransferase
MSPNPGSHWGTDAVDPYARSLPALKARFLIDRVPATGRVLDIGSGGGKILRTLARYKPELELYGCDVREPTEPPDVYSFSRMDRDLPFADESFDVVLIVDVLEHVADPRHLLAQAARVLRPHGHFIGFIPVEGEPLSFYELFRRLLGRDIYVLTKEHVHALTHDEARTLVKAEFEIAETRYAYHALGQLFDATFFAAARVKSLRDLWWGYNVFYNSNPKSFIGAAGLMNRLLVAANAVAATESTLFAQTRFASCGILVHAVSRKGA